MNLSLYDIGIRQVIAGLRNLRGFLEHGRAYADHTGVAQPRCATLACSTT